MTEEENILTDLAQKIIFNNLKQLNQTIEDFNNLLERDPAVALQNLSMLSKEDQQTPAEIIEKLIDESGWRLPDGSLSKNDIYLDPCCGRGGILAHLHKHYKIPKENLYGIDIKQENVALCNKLGFNVIKGDVLLGHSYRAIKELAKKVKGDLMIKITKVLMNPPYDGSLHLQILDMVSDTLPDAEIVNLSPILPLYEYYANNRKIDFKHINDYKIATVIKEQTAEKEFGLSNIGSDLGIWVKDKNKDLNKKVTLHNLFGNIYGLIKKLITKINELDTLNNHTIKYSKHTKQYTLKFVYGLSLSNHGLQTASSFNITSLNLETASQGIESNHTRYVEFDTSLERDTAHRLYCSIIMRFIYKEVLCGRCDYKLVPWIEPARLVNKNIDEELIALFNITSEEYELILAEMTPFMQIED